MAEKNNTDAGSMAELLESYEGRTPASYKPGDRVKCEIISIGKDTVFMDLGAGIDGVVETADLLDKNGELKYAVGETLELYVIRAGENEIRLAVALHGQGGMEEIESAFDNKVPVAGKVKEACKGGFSVTLMGKRAFCPISQIDSRYVEEPADYVGKSFEFLITEFKENGRNIVVSRRKLLDVRAAEIRETFMSGLAAGAVLEGRVIKIMPYGAFIELAPGIEGMVHVSEFSWSRIGDPSEVVSEGENIAVKVLEVDNSDAAKPRISLSVKQTSANPWEKAVPDFKCGDRVKGRVVSCRDFGAFVEIAPGVEGLVHISEMSYVKRVNNPREIVAPGDEVFVVIKDVDHDSRKLSLSLKDAEGDPWQDVPQKYKPGTKVEGTLEKKERFGWFVNLEAGVTALLPNSEIGRSADAAAFEQKKPGEAVKLKVKDVNALERKMTLSPADAEGSDDWKEYSGGGTASLGSLADKLKAAMEKKDKG